MIKRTLFFIFIATLLVACKHQTEETYQCVAPFPPSIQIDNISDCIVPARFSIDDFNWMGANLTMTVFSEDIYDAVEISLLKIGDTLVFGGERMVVDSIAEEGDIIVVNGGMEEGGAWLRSNGGGTYRAVQFDDHSLYTTIGKVEIPLADDFVFIDCGDYPTDPSDTIREGQKCYIEALDGDKKEFSCLNTRVLIEKGLITEINRHWIP